MRKHMKLVTVFTILLFFILHFISGCAPSKNNKKTNAPRATSGRKTTVTGAREPSRQSESRRSGQAKSDGNGSQTRDGNGTLTNDASLIGESGDSIRTSREAMAERLRKQAATEITTAECRITNDDKLSAEQQKQSYCEAFGVKTEDDGTIQFTQLHTLTNLAARVFRPQEVTMAGEKITAVFHSQKKVIKKEVAQGQRGNVSDVLYAAYELPYNKSDINFNTLKVKIKFDGKEEQELNVDELFEKIEEEGTAIAIERLKDPAALLKNINFTITFEFSLNAVGT